MGLLQLENAVMPVDGRFVTRFMEYETVGCKHCRAVIAVLVKGCSRDYQSKYTCPRCCRSVCLKCAEWMRNNGGQCPGPFEARIEAAIKAGNGNLLRTHIYRYRR